MEIRTATISDLDAIAKVEAECFPLAEAATKEEFSTRLKYYANHFWLMFDDKKLVSFVDGFCTNSKDLSDEMYANASLHNEFLFHLWKQQIHSNNSCALQDQLPA